MPQYYDPDTGKPVASPQSQGSGKQYYDPDTGQPVSTTATSPSLMQEVGSVAKNTGIGALKGLGSSLDKIGNVVTLGATSPTALQFYNKHLGTNLHVPTAEENAAPFQAHGTAQSLGKGVEQAGEFLLPGLGEDAAAAKLAEFAPQLGRAALPLAKVATSALGAGTVNKAQGGSFGTGAAMGAAGQIVGQGLKALAPVMAETALGIPKAARVFGKTPGRAILDETSGVRPETVAASARAKMGELTPQLESAADAASVRPNSVRGLLPAPGQEIPLHSSPSVSALPSRPITLTEPGRPAMLGLPAPTGSVPMAPGLQDVFPERLASGTSSVPLRTFGESTPGMSQSEYIGEVPGERGGPGQVQGVLNRPFQAPIGARPLPAMEPNPVASLAPARAVIGDAMGRAGAQNAEGLFGQLGRMNDFLGSRFATGDPIPENVTPRDLLNLKRGFSEEHLRWNPETHDAALSAGRRAYGALDSELDRTVPQAADINQRISSLIPVAQRGESISRNAPLMQRVAGRFAARTGALTGAGLGGYAGYREGGVPGAIAGGLAGAIVPEMVADPAGQMVTARTLNSIKGLRPLVGAALQFDRKKEARQ